MKIKYIVIVSLLGIGMTLLSGCQNLGGKVVNMMYGRSGVFVTNNYEGFVIHVTASNGSTANIRTGDTMQFITAGFINGDVMFLEAKFYDSSGKYEGYDKLRVRVQYNNGKTFVRTWDPCLRQTYKLK
jgi:hypothetical protein